MERRREVRIDLDGAVEVGDGALVVALQPVGRAAIVVGDVVIGIEPDRLLEVGDGAVGSPLGGVRAAAIVVGQRLAGLSLSDWSKSAMARS